MQSEKEIEPPTRPLWRTPVGYALRDFGLGEDFDWTECIKSYDNKEALDGFCTEISWNECVNRFISQIRDSQGYDVDVIPPGFLLSPFIPEPFFKKCNILYPLVKRAVGFAIEKLNDSTVDKTYELEDIVKVVSSTHLMYLLTFTVKQVNAEFIGDGDGNGAGAAVTTYQATVYVPAVETGGTNGYELHDLRVKPASPPPPPQATTGA